MFKFHTNIGIQWIAGHIQQIVSEKKNIILEAEIQSFHDSLQIVQSISFVEALAFFEHFEPVWISITFLLTFVLYHGVSEYWT